MNLKQAMAVTPCRWEYFGFEDLGIKLSPDISHCLIKLFSFPSESKDILHKIRLDKYLRTYISDEYFNNLVLNRLNALQCLVEYFVLLERNLERDVTDLPADAIAFLKEQDLL